jgi:TetR/AcrR family transcriptional regulator, transcriptional repressor for nem operon
MGRPAEFDRDEALRAAIRVFARHGFAAASTSDLLEGMRIARQSLYGAFGDKRGLFLEALECYSERSRLRMEAAMDQEKTAVVALEAALMIDLGSGADLETGCLGVGSIAEFGRSDPSLNALADRFGAEIVSMLADRVRKGMEAGELKPDLEPEAVGRMLLTLKSGLKVAVRGGDGEARQSARLVLAGLAAG